ncbi:putative DD41D transposase [Trichonephila clavipes]|nr:putative DD41D transposase [Trichonephila clavipes]
MVVVPDFHKRILFSDEAHFWLNGYVNKQNCRIWSEANPQVYVETPLHPEKLTVWCALWAGGIIGPYFFKTMRATTLQSMSLVYADKPQTLDHLEDNIRRVIADIRPQMLEKVIGNWTSRLDYIRASRCNHMPEIIFKICQVIYSQFGLAIHQNDHQARRRFVEWAQNEIAVVSDFHKRILFSDEAHFWLNGYVNKQNCRIWSEANPQVYVETPLHPEKLTVWCASWAGGIIDPYFFKNEEGHNVTVNGDRYRAMITNFFIPELSNHDVQELWFQQDGATCHTARATIDLLKDAFGDRLI